MLLFILEQVFLPMGEVWSMYNADTQGTLRERGGLRAENFYVKFFYLAIKYEFYFTLY